MDTLSLPTKTNLAKAKRSLKMSQMGYNLMDKKRTILIAEITRLVDKASNIESKIDISYSKAYKYLKAATIEKGSINIKMFAESVPVDKSVKVLYRSIMGCEIPTITYGETLDIPFFSIIDSTNKIDNAIKHFRDIRDLTLKLAEIENSIHRLAATIQKTNKRANALENITIPKYKFRVKDISSKLEEKEREDFTRLKVLKK